MEKILLFASNWKVRQLYHELLLSKNLEILPIEEIAEATVLLMLSQYKAVILYVEDGEKESILLFLNLRNQHAKLLRTKLILLVNNKDYYSSQILAYDYIINYTDFTKDEILRQIKLLLKSED